MIGDSLFILFIYLFIYLIIYFIYLFIYFFFSFVQFKNRRKKKRKTNLLEAYHLEIEIEIWFDLVFLFFVSIPKFDSLQVLEKEPQIQKNFDEKRKVNTCNHKLHCNNVNLKIFWVFYKKKKKIKKKKNKWKRKKKNEKKKKYPKIFESQQDQDCPFQTLVHQYYVFGDQCKNRQLFWLKEGFNLEKTNKWVYLLEHQRRSAPYSRLQT